MRKSIDKPLSLVSVTISTSVLEQREGRDAMKALWELSVTDGYLCERVRGIEHDVTVENGSPAHSKAVRMRDGLSSPEKSKKKLRSKLKPFSGDTI